MLYQPYFCVFPKNSDRNWWFRICRLQQSYLCNCRYEGSCSDRGNTFDTETVLDATLYVPQGCIEKYENADYWRYFQVIKEIGTQTGIDSVTASDDAKEVARYGINGQLLNGQAKGLNIVKYSDGTIKRVMVK